MNSLERKHLLRQSLRAIDLVYERYKPWDPLIDPSKKREADPQYIPLGKEEDFRSQLYATLVYNNPRLLEKRNYTCMLHSEFGLRWVKGLAAQNSREELDLAFVDLNAGRPPFHEERDGHELCKNARLVGAIEIKRNLEPRVFRDVMDDIDKLERVANAMSPRQFWGIVVLESLWYWKKGDGVRGPQPVRTEQFKKLLGKLYSSRKNGFHIYFRAYHWYKSRELKEPVILTEEDDVDVLQY